jgi:hypothetical protein
MNQDVSMNQYKVMNQPEVMNQPKVMNQDVSMNQSDKDLKKPKKKSYNSVMAELLKPPPKEDKPNIHLSGGGKFSKLDKI